MDKTIRNAQNIPYFDHDKNIIKTIRNSGERRKMNPIHFTLRKVRNILLYRLAYLCPLNSLRIKMHSWRGVNIGKNVYIGQQCMIDNAYPEYIYIGDNVSVAGEVSLIAHSNPYMHLAPVVESKVAPIIIEEGAWIGVKAIILLGVVIGKNAIISAGTVVDRNVAPFTLVRGNPMRKVSEFEYMFQNKKQENGN